MEHLTLRACFFGVDVFFLLCFLFTPTSDLLGSSRVNVVYVPDTYPVSEPETFSQIRG